MKNDRFIEKIKEKIQVGNIQIRVEKSMAELENQLAKDKDVFCTCYNGFGIVGDTIITYDGNSHHVIIPAQINNRAVKRVGAGAFCGNTNLLSVEIEEGVEEIGECAFDGCAGIRTIRIPSTIKSIEESSFFQREDNIQIFLSFKVDRATRNRFIQNGIELADNRILINQADIKSLEIEKRYRMAAVLRESPSVIDKKMCVLFCMKRNGLKQLTFRGSPIFETEESALMYRIQHRLDEPYSLDAELKNDILRRGYKYKLPDYENVRLAIMNKRSIRSEADFELIEIEIISSIVFWQSIRKVRVNKKDIYVYRREYLTSNEKCPFKREDKELYTSEGKLNKGRDFLVAQKKYNLLTLL